MKSPNRILRIVSSSMLLLLFIAIGTAQDQEAATLDALKDQFSAFSDSLDTAPNGTSEAFNLGFQFTNNPVNDSILMKSYTDQYVFNVKHEQRAFMLQFYSSIFIFILVVVIVALGLYLSFKQFKLNEEIVRHGLSQNAPTLDKGTDTASSFEVNKDGLKMNTAVIGLMILVISLVFFFLYLKFVYHIDFVK